MTITTSSPVAAAFDDLDADLYGSLHLPGSDDYVRLATPWNVAVGSRPLAVVAAANAADVVTAVRWAGAHGVQVAVRATGHGAADELDDVLLVHTGGLDELTVTPTGFARVGAGVKWERVIAAAARYGLAPLAGSAPDVGVVGYLTGGGVGPLARTFGVSSDWVSAIEVVTGDGEFRRVTARHEPGLFWGLRGGKGALGIVTAIEFGLVRIPTLLGGALYFAEESIPAVLRAWAAWSPALPELVTTSVAILRLPEAPFVPAPLAGRTTIAVRWAWTGDPVVGDALLEPIRRVAPIVFGGVGIMPLESIGMIHSDPVDPMPTSERATLLRALPQDAVEALLQVAGPGSGSPQIVTEIRQYGGAVARQPEVASAFSNRDAAFSVLTIGINAGPLAAATAADADRVASAMAPWSTGAQFPNFAPSTDPEQALKVYDCETLARLGALIAAYDPGAVISASQPIREALLLTVE